MAWIKIDDAFADHPKVRSVGAIGQAIQVAAICYCGRFLTDGFLSYSVADSLIKSVIAPVTGLNESTSNVVTESVADSATDRRNGKARIYTLGLSCGMSGRDAVEFDWSAIMVNAGLWDVAEDGYVVHDYLEYNPPRDEVLAKRSQRKEAAKSAARKTNLMRWGSPTPSPTRRQSGEASGDTNDIAPVPVPVKSNTHTLSTLEKESISNTAMSNAPRARGGGNVDNSDDDNACTLPVENDQQRQNPVDTQEFLDRIGEIWRLDKNAQIGISCEISLCKPSNADLMSIVDLISAAASDGRLGTDPGITNPVGWIRKQIRNCRASP